MLVIAPHLVHLDKVESMSNIATHDWAEGDLFKGGEVSLYRRFKEMTPTGVYGDATLASKEKGEAITKVVSDRLEIILTEFKKGV